MNLRYLEAAKAELNGAIDYYNAQRAGLGDDFADEIDRVAARLEQFPHSGSPFHRNTRICRTKRFPYGLVYRVQIQEIEVLAVMHLHRLPDYWKDRLNP